MEGVSLNWGGFEKQAPKLASQAKTLFDKTGLVVIGTLRRDGSPRVSPVEFLFDQDELYLGMMPRSYKAKDLIRDPRLSLHSAVADRMASDGEFKLHGRARRASEDKDECQRYCKGMLEKIGWSPEGMPFELFAVEVVSAAMFLTSGDSRSVNRFRLGKGLDEFQQGIEGGE